MRYVTRGKAQSIAWYLARRPSGAGTAVVMTSAGAVLQSSPTVSLDSVNTTLSAAAQAGSPTLSVTSASGVAVGTRYLLAGPEMAGGEVVTVAGVSGTTVTLARRLRRAAASGATFQGIAVSVAITTASTAEASRNLRVEWTDPDTGDVENIPFDVVRWSLGRGASIEDVRALDAQLSKYIPPEAWLPDTFTEAWDIITDDLATKDRVPGGFGGVVELRRAHAYLVLALLLEQSAHQPGIADRVADLRQRYQQERDRTLEGLPYDRAGDGVAATGAGSWRGFELVRG